MSEAATDKPVKVRVFSTPEHLPVVRAAAERMCRIAGFDEDSTTQVILSVDEAMTNVIRHAYDGADDQPIEIELAIVVDASGAALRVCIHDYGRWVDPSLIRARDVNEVRPGGLGVYIMKECMDQLDYQRGEEGGTVLTMVKRLPARRGGSNE